jgi:two-component system, response regulator PdtaR
MPPIITVLVVEDEPLIRMDISDQLQDLGFKVLEAGNASEAIAILAENQSIQVVFTDVDMPGDMDGLRLAAAVRDRWPPIHIIVTSGHRRVSAGDMPHGSRFFGKPYQADRIATAMLEMLQQH